MPSPKRLLFSVDEIEIERDREMFTETYFVSLGYAATLQDGKCHAVTGNEAPKATDEILDLITPTDVGLKDWFHITTSPIFKLRRRRAHSFVGGLPLYYGVPGAVSSVYLAVMEGDKRARQAGEAIRKAVDKLPTTGVFDALGKLAAVGATAEIALVKEAFSLVVKVVEQALINNRDDISYTNVFTFKESNDYLRGVRKVNNQRVALTVSAETI